MPNLPENSSKSSVFPALLDTLETSDCFSSVSIGEFQHQFITNYCSDCGYSYQSYMRCGDRCCPECRQRDYFRLLGAYKAFLASKTRLRLITLTLKGRADVLPHYRVIRLRRAFKKLLLKSYYKSRLVGGLYSIEAKKKLTGWNIHIHILAEGRFIEQKKLSRDWYSITGDSYIVDIRDAWSGVGGLKYILKYLTKSPETLGCNAEYNSAFKGVRLVSPFGTWFKKIVLLEKELKTCPNCGCKIWLSEFELSRFSFQEGWSPPYNKADWLKTFLTSYREIGNSEMSGDINRTEELPLIKNI